MIICHCGKITKGEIRRAIHEGMFTITELRRYLRSNMGQTCDRLVRELGFAPDTMPTATRRVPMQAVELAVLGNERLEKVNP